nr:hypothetical protein [Tanacetum cinerariifolium]
MLRALEGGALCALGTALGAVPVLVIRGMPVAVKAGDPFKHLAFCHRHHCPQHSRGHGGGGVCGRRSGPCRQPGDGHRLAGRAGRVGDRAGAGRGRYVAAQSLSDWRGVRAGRAGVRGAVRLAGRGGGLAVAVGTGAGGRGNAAGGHARDHPRITPQRARQGRQLRLAGRVLLDDGDGYGAGINRAPGAAFQAHPESFIWRCPCCRSRLAGERDGAVTLTSQIHRVRQQAGSYGQRCPGEFRKPVGRVETRSIAGARLPAKRPVHSPNCIRGQARFYDWTALNPIIRRVCLDRVTSVDPLAPPGLAGGTDPGEPL